MSQKLFCLIFFLIGLLSPKSFAFVDPVPDDIKIPDKLYHWMNTFKMDQMAKDLDKKRPNELSLDSRRIKRGQFVNLSACQLLEGRRGLFTWKNPVGAMLLDPKSEDYTFDPRGHSAPLTELTLDHSKISAIHIKTKVTKKGISHNFSLGLAFGEGLSVKEYCKQLQQTLKLKKVNLIYHEVLTKDDEKRLKEWIILDPSIVKSFHANPDILAPKLNYYLKRLTSASPDF